MNEIAGLNRRLAELRGWTGCIDDAYLGGPAGHPPGRPRIWEVVPDYCHDWNAVHNVWMGLSRDQKSRVFGKLRDIKDRENRGCSAWEALDCTPTQWVEALIHTLEEKP
jgi:hypothetical protein